MNKKINLIKIFLLCPVPEEQKPINKYLNLKKYLSNNYQNPIFVKKYTTSIQIKLFNFFNLIFKKIKSFNFNFFLFFRLDEIIKCFKQSFVIYEETSWYDAEIWEKPFPIIKNDRLISSQIIWPYFKKLLFLFFFVFIFFLKLIFYFE
jgi:hypothetical protein